MLYLLALVVFHVVIGIFTMVSHSMVIYLFVKLPEIRSHSSNMHVISLGCTDSFVGFMTICVGLAYSDPVADWLDHEGLACVLLYCFVYCSIVCSIFSMTFIALDRLFYITTPFAYQRNITSQNTAALIVMVWTMSFVWGTVPLYTRLFDYEVIGRCTERRAIPIWYRNYANIALLFIATMTTGTVYLILTQKALRIKRKIQKMYGLRGGRPNPSVPGSTEAAKSTVSTLKSNLKSLKLFCIVFGLMFLSWFPYYVVEFISDFVTVGENVFRICIMLGFLNSAFNVFVYPLYNKKIRTAWLQMLFPCFKSEPDLEDNISSCRATPRTSLLAASLKRKLFNRSASVNTTCTMVTKLSLSPMDMSTMSTTISTSQSAPQIYSLPSLQVPQFFVRKSPKPQSISTSVEDTVCNTGSSGSSSSFASRLTVTGASHQPPI